MLSYLRPMCNNHNKKLWAKIEIQSCQLQKYIVVTTHRKKKTNIYYTKNVWKKHVEAPQITMLRSRFGSVI